MNKGWEMKREGKLIEIVDENMKKILIVISEINKMDDWNKILATNFEKKIADFKILIEIESDFFSDKERDILVSNFFDSHIMAPNLEEALIMLNKAKSFLTPKGPLDLESENFIFLGWIEPDMWNSSGKIEVYFKEIDSTTIYRYLKKEKKEIVNEIEDLEIFLPTTIFNIENAISLKEKITSQKEFSQRKMKLKSFPYAETYIGDFFNIFNISLEEFLSLENFSRFSLAQNESKVFFLVVESLQIEKIGRTVFEKTIKKLAEKKFIDKRLLGDVIIPIIIDLDVSSYEESERYSDISISHFICKNSEEAKQAIEGILLFSTQEQYFPFQISPGYFETFFHFYKSRRLLFKIYEGNAKDFDIKVFLKDLKYLKIKEYLVNIITEEGTISDCNKLIDEINKYLEPNNHNSSLYLGFIDNYTKLRKKDDMLIIIYASNSLYK